MKKKLGLLFLAFSLATITACGKEEKTNKAEEPDALLPLEVELTVTETVDVNEMVKIEAVVTQGEEKIEDADEVEFEIWEDGKKEESIKLASTNEKDGVYTAEKAFEKDGVYTIQSHVTARNLHTMPMKTVTVGQGAEESDHATEEHEHGGTEGFSLHFNDLEHAMANMESDLVTHLQMEGKPLEKVNVRYEIWNEATPDKHEWVDAKETVAGEYSSSYTFTEAGTYTVQIHVKDEQDLHEHEEHTIVIK